MDFPISSIKESGACLVVAAVSAVVYSARRDDREGTPPVPGGPAGRLSRALDDALQRLWDEGKYAELYLRFFPVSPF